MNRLKRFSKIAQLGGELLKETAKGAIKESLKTAEKKIPEKLKTRIQQAEVLTKHLKELKGAAMKVGQILSLQGEELFPKEVQDILAQLQNKAQSMPKEKVTEILKKELGTKFEELLNFSEQPIASASIGQVHSANFKAVKNTVIKVQYPGVSESIDSDIDILKKVLKLTSFSYGLPEANHIIEESRSILKQEADYKQELGFLNTFRELLDGDERFIVPKSYPEYSTKKILTMEHIEGLHLNEFLQTNPSQEVKNTLGRYLFELEMRELFEFNIVQTDPNFANYLFIDNTAKPQIGLLDFGATKILDKNYMNQYAQFIMHVKNKNRSEADKLCVEMKFLHPDEPVEVFDLHWEICLHFIKPFEKDVYDFKNSNLPSEITKDSLRFAKLVKKSQPPKDLIFVQRKMGGIFQLLRRLEVKENFSNEFISYLNKTLYTE